MTSADKPDVLLVSPHPLVITSAGGSARDRPVGTGGVPTRRTRPILPVRSIVGNPAGRSF
ncbi:hypothetical protein [Micromonospora purpureochromogenes]|uniref:hypothetical protein n=1 Tax=Micromonospora purpureochromogenes TaxID=47872 RepID=UPI0012FD59F5|nr:hypothetical protein [Micromonospora purpureochromogenes]